MKWSFANVGLLLFGLFGILIITFFNELTVSNEQDYYTLKDAVEASMIEAVDVTYFRLTGGIKINQEKFVENLTRRFSEVATFGEGNYNLEFYQISESPPKVSVRVVDATNSYNIFGTFGADPTQINIVNEVTAIMDVSKDIDSSEIFPSRLISFDDLNFYGEFSGVKIYEYDNKYYQLQEESSDVDKSVNCGLYSDYIECFDNVGNVIVLEKIFGEPVGSTDSEGAEGSDESSGSEENSNLEDSDDSDESSGSEENSNLEDSDESIDDEKNKPISVSVVEFKGGKLQDTDLGFTTHYEIIPKYSYYLLYNNFTYVPVDVNAPILGYNNFSCMKNGESIDCVYNSKTYTYKKVAGLSSDNSPLRCFKLTVDDPFSKKNEYGYFLSNIGLSGPFQVRLNWNSLGLDGFLFKVNDVVYKNDVPCTSRYYDFDNFETGSLYNGGIGSHCFGNNATSYRFVLGNKSDVCDN